VLRADYSSGQWIPTGSYYGGMDIFDAADAQSRTNSKEMLNVSFINVGKNVCTTLHGC
jgi:hypothetical protein